MNDIAHASIREVAVALPESDHFAVATTVSGLMGILTSSEWPKQPNDTAWQHALATCTRCLQLETDTTKARNAFVVAARDAGFKVLPDDERKPRLRAKSSTGRPPVRWRRPDANREKHGS